MRRAEGASQGPLGRTPAGRSRPGWPKGVPALPPFPYTRPPPRRHGGALREADDRPRAPARRVGLARPARRARRSARGRRRPGAARGGVRPAARWPGPRAGPRDWIARAPGAPARRGMPVPARGPRRCRVRRRVGAPPDPRGGRRRRPPAGGRRVGRVRGRAGPPDGRPTVRHRDRGPGHGAGQDRDRRLRDPAAAASRGRAAAEPAAGGTAATSDRAGRRGPRLARRGRSPAGRRVGLRTVSGRRARGRPRPPRDGARGAPGGGVGPRAERRRGDGRPRGRPSDRRVRGRARLDGLERNHRRPGRRDPAGR